ncbi:MAG TPA: amino acid adenylation domain-containing protein, partial [Longimicrobium sp.]
PFDLSAGPLFRAGLFRLDVAEHVLVVCMHHVISDGLSLAIFLRELSVLYGACRDGGASPLPPLPLRYVDYAAWQRAQLAGDRLRRRLAWWKERLAGAPAVLEVPADHPRPAIESHRGASVSAALPGALVERLRELARAERTSLYMVMLAAFQALLARYAGVDDVVVGTPVAGRPSEDVEGLIGFFANTLVLRTDLGGDPTFRALLRRVRGVVLEAHEHQEVPFEQLVAELRPERSLSHSPLFQVLFTLDPDGLPDLRLPGTSTAPLHVDRPVSQFDLSLVVTRSGDGWSARAHYRTDLFDRATLERMLARLRLVVEQVAGDADLRLSDIELLAPEERAQVVEEWNRTRADYPAERCIHQLFERQAARTPERIALVFEGDSLTYGKLNARANRLAHRLRRLGAGPEAPVGLCMERSLEMVVSILAILKAGGAYVPLDPGYPAERLEMMLADSAVTVLLTQERLRGAVPIGAETTLVCVDAEWEEIAGERADDPASGVFPGNLAYVIYTSGSTGRPKGVMTEHAAVVNRLCWMQAEFGLGAGDVVLQKTPVSFDVSVWELFWPLQQGATLVMARSDGHRDPAYLRDVVERRGVTTLHFVPSMLQPFLDVARPERCRTLKRVICSGEALSPALAARFHEQFPATVSLHNLYGPTEAAVDVSHWPCARDGADVVPIGRPIWNTRLYVLDAALRPLPVGIPGELYIGGVQVARGYLDGPALTAERFVPDPFGAPGTRLYRTGDRARWIEVPECEGAKARRWNSREDASHDAESTLALSHSRTFALQYLGRLDQQVKVRGFRIEPGEVEAALRAHAGVRDCAVAARPDADGELRLVAYVAGAFDADVLRAHLRRTLPEHMVPGAFVSL